MGRSKYIFISILVILSSNLFAVTRDEVIDSAKVYADLQWIPDYYNTGFWANNYEYYGRDTLDPWDNYIPARPCCDFSEGDTIEGVAYAYGWAATPYYFKLWIDELIGAGNHACHYWNYYYETGIRPPNWTTGIDCSGLACNCGQIARINTDSLAKIGDSISLYDVEKGDIIVKGGKHVVIVDYLSWSLDTLYVYYYEATGLPPYTVWHTRDTLKRFVNQDYIARSKWWKEAGIPESKEGDEIFVYAPTGLTGAQLDENVVLNWTASQEGGAKDGLSVSGYYIYRGMEGPITGKVGYTLYDGVSNTTTYTDSNVSIGTKYYYKVAAYSTDPYMPSWYSNGVSIAVLDTILPQATVISPDGGEDLACESVHKIRWTATDNLNVDSVNIYYTTSWGMSINGFDWHLIAHSEPNDSSYSWKVPNTPSTSCRIKIIAYDPGGNSAVDASDADFTISDQTPPKVAVLFPNGGEHLEMGETYEIGWEATDNVTPKSDILITEIEYSLDGGASWDEIPRDGVNDGIQEWTVPDTLSEHCRVRITAQDIALNLGEGMSNSDFSTCWLASNLVEATGYSNQRKLLLDSAGDLHLAFSDSSDNNIVRYAKSTDNGASWLIKEIIGQGKFPSLTECSGGLCCCWMKEESGNYSLLYSRKDTTGWSAVYDITPTGVTIDTMFPPATVVDNNTDTLHIVTDIREGDIHKLMYGKFNINEPASIVWETVQSYQLGGAQQSPPPPPPPSRVSIDLAPDGTPHIAWDAIPPQEKTGTWYITKVGGAWDVVESFGGQSPFIDVEDNDVHIVYEVASDVGYDIWHRIIGDGTENISNTPYYTSLAPQILEGVIVWSEKRIGLPSESLHEIYYKIWDGTSWQGPYNISNTPQSSRYPQSIVKIEGADSILYCAWLDGNISPYEVRFAIDTFSLEEEEACPFLYVWNGDEFVEDNNVLAGSGGGEGVIDWYKLTKAPVKKDNRYLIEIREGNTEHSFFDKVDLLAVDHPDSVHIFVGRDGTIFPLIDLLSPTLFTDGNGTNYTEAVESADWSQYYQGYAGATTTTEFGKELIEEGSYVVIVQPREKFYPYTLDLAKYEDGEWQYAGSIIPRENWSTEAIALALSGEDVPNIKLTWHAPHKLDYIGLGKLSAAKYLMRPYALTSAIHSKDGSVKQKLLVEDKKYAELISGDTIKLKFAITGLKPGWVRDFIFVSTGHYIIEGTGTGGAQAAGASGLPYAFSLSQNFPNPFCQKTVISYELPVVSKVSLKIYDVVGKLVKTLVNEEKRSGRYSVKWDTKEFPSGVYFVRFTARQKDGGQVENYKATKKLILVR
ncbi:T9SS type A sorting domain-containing protein [candidate division WOR-3 bacterium]|nr:T9SS type A sorting domain-containing protein [candidate division WOR-3 bacterium]